MLLKKKTFAQYCRNLTQINYLEFEATDKYATHFKWRVRMNNTNNKKKKILSMAAKRMSHEQWGLKYKLYRFGRGIKTEIKMKVKKLRIQTEALGKVFFCKSLIKAESKKNF